MPATSTRSSRTFDATGYVREAIGPDALHRGITALREYFARASAPVAASDSSPVP